MSDDEQLIDEAAEAMECMMHHGEVTIRKGSEPEVTIRLALGGANATEGCDFEFVATYRGDDWARCVARAHDMMHRLLGTVSDAHPIGGDDVPRAVPEMH